MVKHVVMWTLQGDKAESGKIVREKFESLPAQISDILSLEVGFNFNPDSGHDLILITTHKDKDALARYQKHPYHQSVVAFVPPYLANRVCVDFEIEK